MINHVASLGQTALALTDHESLSGHVKFIKSVKELKKQDKIPQNFKPILGNEIYLVDEDKMRTKMEGGESVRFYHFLLLAKDAEGHRLLRKLSTRAWERMFTHRGMERVPTFYTDIEEILSENPGHIIASSACLGSYFATNVLKLISEDCEDEMFYKYKIHDFVTWCIDVFGKDDFYIEIQPSKESVEQIEYNKMAIKIAKAYDLKYVMTTDVHYIKPEDRGIHKAYLTSDEDSNGNREVDAFYSSTHFFTIEMLLDYMDYLDREDVIKAIKCTREIADKVEEYDLAHKQIIPKVVLPEKANWYHDEKLYEIANEYPSIKRMIGSDEIYDNYLVSLTLKGINEKIPERDYRETFERMDIECKEILDISVAKQEPVSSYFVTMEKNIDIIWEEAQSVIGTSRGSAAGFVINYLVGITQVNPLKQGVEMPHWRFVSGLRPDYPDIDIDVSSHKRDIVFKCLSNYYESIGGKIVRVCTFGTETSKSTILTACRGLKINNDVGLYLSSLIPVERGFVWSIEDCYYGNEELGREPVPDFKNTVDKYEGLLEVALGIQGLVNKRSSHACGILIVNEDFTKHNAIMRTPSKEIVSQFNLEDSEYVGNIKYDLLNTKTCGMIQKTLEMLVEHNKIEWQGTLRKTYDKYLHPDVIDKNTIEMWEMLHEGELISAFQFDSNVGQQALKSIKPMNLLEATNANNLMRLMSDGEGKEQPLEMYVRYKNNIEDWYHDMKNFGLNDKEINIMKKHLFQDYGVCSSQERMMLLSMDEDIANFDVVESNVLRKSVAKKKKKLLEQSEQRLYEKGLEVGASKKLLQYVWDVQIAMQRGYGFSVLHGVGYTYILIQQLNLIYYYPSIYWNTAVLLVESGALEQDTLEDEDDTEDMKERKEKTTNYGTVAKAIGNMQQQNVDIALPDINIAELGFKPDESNNRIIFGLKGIMKISNETSRLIMENRPFTNLEDFYKRMVLTKREVTLKTGKKQNKSLVSDAQTIMLIKAGAFDELENKPREQILLEYLKMTNPEKKSLTVKGIEQVIQMGIVPPEYKDEIRLHNFKNYINNNDKIQDKDTKSIKWHSLSNGDDDVTEYAANFFNEQYVGQLTEGKDYYYDDNGIVYVAMGTDRKGSFNDIHKQKMKSFLSWLNSKDCIDKYNEHIFDEIKKEHMSGSVASWEMESLNYYNDKHELAHVDTEKYKIENFFDLPEEPVVIGFTRYKGMEYPKFELSRIVGTVLDKDKTKHMITLLTPNGVVQVKFYSGQFAFYDKQISVQNENGKKTVLEESWFKRGGLLLVTGFRRQDQFKPKRYKESVFPHTLQKIVQIEDDGSLILQSVRHREEDD